MAIHRPDKDVGPSSTPTQHTTLRAPPNFHMARNIGPQHVSSDFGPQHALTPTQVLETFDTAIEAALHVARFMGPHASAAAAAIGSAEVTAADVKAAAAAAAAAHSAARKKQRVAEENAFLRAAEERSLARLASERNDDDVYAAHLLLGLPAPST